MKYKRIPLVALLAFAVFSLISSALPLASASVQNQSTALERGYRTGYSDGYNAGTRDVSDNATRDYRNKEDYQRADRSFNEAWGTIEDYRDGYQQGFEAGYAAGYDKRTFDSSIPTDLRTRGVTDPATHTNTPASSSTPDNQDASAPTASQTSAAPVYIARDAMLLIELDSGLSTDASQRNDRFQAHVIEPREFAGAIVEGRVSLVKRAGKVKGTSELQLSFESIRMPDGRTHPFSAAVVEIVNTGRSDDQGRVDEEGGVKGRSSTKDDITRVSAGAGVGAIIGAILGGGHGAAIGAAIGGGVGAGSVMTKRGEDVRLPSGQQLRIRTSTETRIE